MKSKEFSSLKHKPFRNAVVLGAGVMGAQIAAHLANAGLSVHLLDLASDKGDKNAIVNGAFKKTQKMKPAPFVRKNVADRITTGNFEDHLEVVASADWVVEAIIEQPGPKKSMMEKLEKLAGPNTVISTNTSGLPLHSLIAGRSDDFKRRFLGTHFFNPPRYLKLLELIPTEDTDPAIMERISWFGRIHLGKGIVVAKDTPNFIANRVGTYSMMLSIKALEKGYTIEEIDALTGTLTGRPRSATFRTADVVGLDTLTYVSKNLYAAIPDDESREDFKIPAVLKKLVEEKRLGSKTGKGFYVKEKGEIKSLNPESFEYEKMKPLDLGDLNSLKKVKSLSERWKKLFEMEGRGGDFIRVHTTALVAYAMNRIPEIADSPADVDDAIRWGFGWDMGPFTICDWIGAERFKKEAKKAGFELPSWFAKMQKEGAETFYKEDGHARSVYIPGKGYTAMDVREDEITVAQYKSSDGRNEIWNNDEAGLLDTGDGVLLFEFRSKANTLGSKVIAGLNHAIDLMEKGSWKGMLIANDGANFSVGANLGEMAYAAQSGDFKSIEKAVENFQMTAQRIRYASKPIVVGLKGKVLGGGCELSMAASTVVAATETYIGLVELGVGLIPAGTGTMYMAARAAEKGGSLHASRVQNHIQEAFETIAMAKVATSGQEAIELGYLDRAHTIISMHEDRRIHSARQEVLRLASQGYLPPPVRNKIYVTGKPGFAPLEVAAWTMQQSGYITEYDAFLAKKLAHILTGGNLEGPSFVHEDHLIDLEREIFLSLLGEKKTQERVHSILTTNKPLRN